MKNTCTHTERTQNAERRPLLAMGKQSNGKSRMTSRLVCLLLLMFLSASALAAEVVINEIHYDPGDNTLKTEFIELWNSGQAGVDLSGWSLANAVNFTFTNGTQLAAGGFLVIAEDPDAIFAEYAVLALGPYEGKLSNEGDHLELRDGSGALQDEVQYQPKFPGR